jgi:hypothetical protein
MARPLRQYENADTAWREVVGVRRALLLLREARDLLTHAGARKASRAVSRAIKSAEGAERHAERIYMTLYYRQRRAEGTA